MLIYLVEDDNSIRELVAYTLHSAGFEAEGFERPSAFWRACAERRPDLVLLDLMLPEEDGISILKKLRQAPETARLPILLLTAKSSEYDKVLGLDSGADDYVAKPFGMMELLARVKALLRRTEQAESEEVYRLGALSVETMSVVAVFLTMAFPLVLILAMMMAVSVFLAFRTAKNITSPINEIDLEHPEQAEVYEELTPLLRRIAVQNREIHRQMAELKRRKEEFDTITSNMQEGLLVMDGEGDILSYNAAAKTLLGVDAVTEGENIFSLNRSAAVRRSVEGALAGAHREERLEANGRICQIFANPVFREEEVAGMILVLLDATEKEEREQLRREFTANVSHELKTPLTSISGFAEIMKNGMVPPADMGKFAEKIYNEAQRLIALVQDIIKLSKLDEKDTSLCEEEVELDALVQEACERLQPAAERKRVTLSAETEPILFRGVKQVLSEMIYNLCDNAIRYNKEGGAVFVTLKQKADRISLTVRDTGIGIAKEEQGRIFERFYRVDASRSAENGGTGLGLSIVKHGAALHNGKIFIESEIGNGTSIEISLPYSIN